MRAQQPRTTILLLSVAQALYSCCIIGVFTTAGIVGLSIAPDKSLATLPVTTFVIGNMLITIPASLLMQRIGRAPVFIAGAVMCAIGAALAVWSIYHNAFLPFCLATAFMGIFQATSGYYRFAAAESAGTENKSIAISWVLTGGVIAAIAGTLIANYSSDILAPFTFAGSYAAIIALALANIVVIVFTHLPKPKAEEIAGPQRSWGELLQQRRLIVAMAAAIVSYALMNLMMTAAPVAMIGCGFTKGDASWVVQWHVLGMFVPSFFTGLLIKRFGVDLITGLGVVLLIAAGIVGLLGISFGHFSIALILLGLGWNFGFIGGTTMLTECYSPSERAKVQAANDFGISALMTVASLSSGAMLSHWGWHSVPMAIFPFSILVLLLILWVRAGRTATAA